MCRGHSYFDSDTVGLLQVPLPNSVFVNTTESCEVERLVQSASCTCYDSVRSLVSLAHLCQASVSALVLCGALARQEI